MRRKGYVDDLDSLCASGLCHAQVAQALNVEASLVTRWSTGTRRRTPNQRGRIGELAERVRACVTPLDLALVVAGGADALAAGTGRERVEVSGWTEVPESALPAVCRITGFQAHVLRPDLYEPPRRRQAVPLAA